MELPADRFDLPAEVKALLEQPKAEAEVEPAEAPEKEKEAAEAEAPEKEKEASGAE